MQRLSAQIKKCSGWFESAIAIIVLLLLLHAESAISDETVQQDLRPVFVELSINRQLIGSTVLVLQNAQNEWLIPVEAVNTARLKLPQTKLVSFDGHDYVPLAAFESAHAAFDVASQFLGLVFRPDQFLSAQLNGSGMRSGLKVADNAGYFFNYDLSLEHSSLGMGQVAFTEIGAAFKPGVFISNFGFFHQPQQSNNLRLESSFTIDQPENITTIRLGDSITKAASIVGRSVRFGGVQYGTNFRTQPQMVTVPMTTLSGQAALPSTVDIFINNALQSRKEISPGPFSISSLPTLSGDGEMQMVIRDLAGREEVISQRFYASPVLLAKGLAEFSVEAGALRNNFGLESNDYGDLFAAGSYRRGITNTATLEGSLQASEHGLTGVLGSATFLIPQFGLGTLAVGLSNSDAGSGGQIALGVERRTARASFSIRSQVADHSYRQLGVDPDRAILRLDSANFSYRFGAMGNLGLAYVRQQLATGSPSEVLSASYATPRKSWGSLIFNALKGRTTTDNYALSVFWIMPMEKEVSGSVLHSHSNQGPDQTILQLQRNSLPGEGVGYRLQAGINAPQQAALLLQNGYGQARLEAAQFNDNTSVRLNFSGALASLDSQWFASQRINSSFGLVRLPGMENVRVYVDNQFAARTNKEGNAFLPRLHPYMANHISVEQLDLAMDTEIDTLLIQPVPAWRSGVTVDFPVRRVPAATLRIVLSDGTPVPVGAVAYLQGQEEGFPIGRDGQAYLSGLKADNKLSIRWLDKECIVNLSFEPVEASVPFLGEFVCESIVP